MPTYSELVGKARELRTRIGEQEFRRRYKNRPSALIRDMGVRVSKAGNRGTEVLEAFQFHELAPHNRELYERIIKNISRLPIDSKSLRMREGTSVGNRLRVLEARGLVRLGKREGQGGKLFVTSVSRGGKWIAAR